MTYIKLMHDVEKSQAAEKNRIATSLLLSAITVLGSDGEVTEAYGQIRAELERKGTSIDSMDLLVAGHARSQGLILVTNNTREFACVMGL